VENVGHRGWGERCVYLTPPLRLHALLNIFQKYIQKIYTPHPPYVEMGGRGA